MSSSQADRLLLAVPVRLIAGFKRMKSLTKDIKIIVAALETSSELVLSGHRVRRKLPLPVVDEAEVLMRTVIVENLPDQATIGSLHWTSSNCTVNLLMMLKGISPPGGHTASTLRAVILP